MGVADNREEEKIPLFSPSLPILFPLPVLESKGDPRREKKLGGKHGSVFT